MASSATPARALIVRLVLAELVLAAVVGLTLLVFWSDLPAELRAALLPWLKPKLALPPLLVLAAIPAWLTLAKPWYSAAVQEPPRLAERLSALLKRAAETGSGAASASNSPAAASSPQATSAAEELQAASPLLAPLVQSINRLLEQHRALHANVAQTVRELSAATEQERNRLAALMSELTQSVVVCNLDGRILLYNQRARQQFAQLALAQQNASAATAGAESAGSANGATASNAATPSTPSAASQPAAQGALLGLGRSIFQVFDRHLIAHALEQIEARLQRGEAQAQAQFLTAPEAGPLLRVQMAPVRAVVRVARDATAASGVTGGVGGAASKPPQLAGYVMLLDDITRSFETESRRDDMLQRLSDGSRGALANIRAAVEALGDYPDMDAPARENFVRIIRSEVQSLSQRLDESSREIADARRTRWPLEEMLGVDLVHAASGRVQLRTAVDCRVDEVDESLWLKVDSFSLMQGLCFLAHRLSEDYEVRQVRLSLTREERHAHLDLIWRGAVVSSETLLAWEIEPMNVGGESNPLTLREVVERHDGEIWSQRNKTTHERLFRLVLPLVTPVSATATAETTAADSLQSRPEYYDFDLFQQRESDHELEDRPLAQLVYTAFDTETTGLEPTRGDEIIQIGAVRIVNGRLLRTESFEQLVDPQRLIDPKSQLIHGISQEMLHGRPVIAQVLPQFHAFCADTVLVAHNAAFDMRFLQLKEASTGVRFAMPVLDTLLLAQALHPHQESHALEAIAERLGVNVQHRHQALGDALVTGEVFLRMLPLLAERGIVTLGQALHASRQSYYARVRY